MSNLYILDDWGEPEICNDPVGWARWLERDEHRVVRQQRFVADGSALFVLTVFVGRDQRYFGDGPPLLWETMVFDEHDDPTCEIDVERYSSRADAIAGHNHIVAELGGPTGAGLTCHNAVGACGNTREPE